MKKLKQLRVVEQTHSNASLVKVIDLAWKTIVRSSFQFKSCLKSVGEKKFIPQILELREKFRGSEYNLK